MLEFFRCFNVQRHPWWASSPPDMVQHKMLHPKRKMNVAATCNRMAEIRERLHKQYGYRMDLVTGKMYKPKPRVRYKLRPCYHWDWDRKQFIGVYQCILACVASLFFLSSTPAEAQYASVSGSWDRVHIVDGHWLSPNRAAYDRPVVFKAYSPFEVRHPKIRFLVGYPRLIDDTAGWRMYARHLERQSQNDALVDGPRVIARDWRKFWAWLIAIGTIGLATVSAISYGRWRSMR